ncbi:MAG: hypothetical protein ABIS14_12835 [Sphingomonas sp.]
MSVVRNLRSEDIAILADLARNAAEGTRTVSGHGSLIRKKGILLQLADDLRRATAVEIRR